jgi:hypothetical protein
VAAERPVLVTGYTGRDPGAFEQLVELAELLAAGVIETGIRLSFPNRHPLNASGAEGVLEAADAVCFLDVKDMGKPTQALDSTTRRVRSRLAPGAAVLDLGFNDGSPAGAARQSRTPSWAWSSTGRRRTSRASRARSAGGRRVRSRTRMRSPWRWSTPSRPSTTAARRSSTSSARRGEATFRGARRGAR